MARGKKTGGRTKGAINIINKEFRDKLFNFSDLALECIEQGLRSKDPFYVRLWCDYTITKPKQDVDIELMEKKENQLKTIIIEPASKHLPSWCKEPIQLNFKDAE